MNSTSATTVIELGTIQGKNKDEEFYPDFLKTRTFESLVQEPSKLELAKADFKNFLKIQPEIDRAGKEKKKLKKKIEELRKNYYAAPKQFRYYDEKNQVSSGLTELSAEDYFKMRVYINDAYAKIKLFDILVNNTM